MLLAVVHAIFALICLWFARAAIRHALPFIRTGWQTIDAEVQKPDYRQAFASQQRISEGGRFLVGGIIWLLIGLVSLGAGILLAAQAIRTAV